MKGSDVVGVLEGLAQLAQYRLKEKRDKVMKAISRGQMPFQDDAIKADRAEYMRDQAFSSAKRVRELLDAARLHRLAPTPETNRALGEAIDRCSSET